MINRARALVRLGIVAALLAAAAVWTGGPATACSCISISPRQAFDRGDVVFIGRAVSKRPLPADDFDPSSGPPISVLWTFEVDEVLKGDLGTTAEVGTGSGDADCGVRFSGEPVGVVARRSEDGLLTTSICGGNWPPEQLRALGGRLAPAVGTGPLAILVGGQLDDVTFVGLDADGGILGYGSGVGEPHTLAVCPGAGTALALSIEPYERGGRQLFEKVDLRSLHVDTRELEITEPWGYLRDFSCLDENGRSASVLWGDGRLILIDGGRPQSVSLPEARSAVKHPSSNHLLLLQGDNGDRVDSFDPATRSQQPIVSLPSGYEGMLATVDPSAGRLAVMAASPDLRTRRPPPSTIRSGAALPDGSPPAADILLVFDLRVTDAPPEIIPLNDGWKLSNFSWPHPDRLLVEWSGGLGALTQVISPKGDVLATVDQRAHGDRALAGDVIFGPDDGPQGASRGVRRTSFDGVSTSIVPGLSFGGLVGVQSGHQIASSPSTTPTPPATPTTPAVDGNPGAGTMAPPTSKPSTSAPPGTAERITAATLTDAAGSRTTLTIVIVAIVAVCIAGIAVGVRSKRRAARDGGGA